MAELVSLIAALAANLLPLFLAGLLTYVVLDAFWAVALWVYGLRTLWGLHRDDLAEAIALERALSPFD